MFIVNNQEKTQLKAFLASKLLIHGLNITMLRSVAQNHYCCRQEMHGISLAYLSPIQLSNYNAY